MQAESRTFKSDLTKWHAFMEAKAPMLVRRPAASWAGGLAEFVVVPQDRITFVMGDFGTVVEALDFCHRNGLPVRLDAGVDPERG